MESIVNKSDNQLKQDIETELRWDPKVNAAEIGVTVNEGVVSLLGTVDTYAEKWAAEDATKRVSGVRTVAQDLTVKIRKALTGSLSASRRGTTQDGRHEDDIEDGWASEARAAKSRAMACGRN